MFAKIFCIKLILCLLSLPFFAQESSAIKNLDGLDSYAEMKLVYGWSRNTKNDKWTVKEEKIVDIDYFDNYYILSFHEQTQKYICIIKQYEEKRDVVFESYIIDYEDYVSKISMWEEHSLLKFPILKQTSVRLKKGSSISKQLLGLDNLSNILLQPKDSFVFQYRFEKDDTVKFLFYKESCLANDCQPAGLNMNEKNYSSYTYVGNDSLYSTFFYKTILKYFTQFTDSPLAK